MNKADKVSVKQTAYLFNVDLLVKGESNAVAMERLLHALNQCGFPDFRIKSGIELGKLISQLETQGSAEHKDKPAPRTSPEASPEINFATEGIKRMIDEQRLIRLTVNKGFGVKLSLPCRVIHFDETSQTITVYHVDEKQVYAFHLNEIDDFMI